MIHLENSVNHIGGIRLRKTDRTLDAVLLAKGKPSPALGEEGK